MKQCSFCGNRNVLEKNTQYIYQHQGQFLIVNNVPCEECGFCGERYFKADVLKKIEKDYFAIQSGKRAKQELRVPVEEFLEIAS